MEMRKVAGWFWFADPLRVCVRCILQSERYPPPNRPPFSSSESRQWPQSRYSCRPLGCRQWQRFSHWFRRPRKHMRAAEGVGYIVLVTAHTDRVSRALLWTQHVPVTRHHYLPEMWCWGVEDVGIKQGSLSFSSPLNKCPLQWFWCLQLRPYLLVSSSLAFRFQHSGQIRCN